MPQQRGQTSSVVLTHRGADGEPVVVLSGQLGLRCVGGFRNAVMDARAQAHERLRVDLSRVPAIDAVGVRTLVACRRLAASAGIDLVLMHPSTAVTQRLGLTRRAKVFCVEFGTGVRTEPGADRTTWHQPAPVTARGAATGR